MCVADLVVTEFCAKLRGGIINSVDDGMRLVCINNHILLDVKGDNDTCVGLPLLNDLLL